MDYPSESSAGLQNGKFTDGDPVNDIPPSPDKAAYMNALYDEIRNVIAGAGLIPDEDNLSQLLQAINARIAANTASISGVFYPHIRTANNQLSVTQGSGEIVINTNQTWVLDAAREFSSDDYKLQQRTLSHVANKTYHLRWNQTDGFSLKDLSDSAYNSAGKPHGDSAFDSTHSNMLIALVQTDSSNTATVTAYRNIALYLRSELLRVTSSTRVVCVAGDQVLMSGPFVNDLAVSCRAVIQAKLWFGSTTPESHGVPTIRFNSSDIVTGRRLHAGYNPGYGWNHEFNDAIPVLLNRGSHTLQAKFNNETGAVKWNPNSVDSPNWPTLTSYLIVNRVGV